MFHGKIKKFNECGWLTAMFLLTLSVCLMAKADFGVSMIVSPAYVLHLALSEKWSWYTFGVSEYIFQGVLLIIMCIAVRRFKWRYLLSFADAVLYGIILDMWFLIFGRQPFADMYVRVIMFVIGLVLTGISIAFFFRTYMPIEVYDLFVTEVVDRYKLKPVAVKWVYDLSMLLIAVILTLSINGSLKGIGIGTLICALINSFIINFFGKILDKLFEFQPLFPKLNKLIGKQPDGAEEIK